ncbi:MAG: TraB family protein [bacterium]
MQRRIMVISLVLFFSFAGLLFAGEDYRIDPAHSRVGFSVKHMVISNVKGNFKEFSGNIIYDEADISKSSVEVKIMTASIDTDNERRDNHLRSDDFFNAENFPKITFVSKKIDKTDNGFVAVGDLTIRDVTKEIELPFEILGKIKTQRGTRIGIHAEVQINRQEYNVKYSRALDTGGLVVSDEVKIEIDLEAVAGGRIVKVGGREFILVGTAHISQQSADLVREVIEAEKPDCVCVELDKQRFKALAERKKWEALDLKNVIRQKQLSTLLVNLLLSSYQKKLGEKIGVTPGIELLEATKVAKEYEIPIALCDRDIRVTLRRAWRSMTFFQKMRLFSSGLAGSIESEEISEDMLSKIRRSDVLTEMMNELGEAMPVLKRVLIDERDAFLAQRIRESEGKRIVAVVGAGHVNGIKKTLEENQQPDMEEINKIPPPSPLVKWIGWGVPALILGSIALIGWTKGTAAAGDNLIFWILANGIPCSLGAIFALAHPVTVASAFVAAPITSLTPVIGAGYVAAFIQAYFQPPVVKEFQKVSDDVSIVKKWWQNKLLRVLLVFILTSLGRVLGTYVGAYEILTNLFN